jgi:hypothetical protein
VFLHVADDAQSPVIMVFTRGIGLIIIMRPIFDVTALIYIKTKVRPAKAAVTMVLIIIFCG